MLLIALTGAILISKYGDDIKKYAIDSLNKELEVKVEVNNIQLSLFKKFPFISIVLADVTTYSNKDLIQSDIKIPNPEILFKANNLFIQFNIINVIRRNYKIKRIIAEEGVLNILADSQGNTNYVLFKKYSSISKHKQNIELEYFKIKNFNILMINKFKNLELKGEVDEILLKGKFSKNAFNLITSGSIFLEKFSKENITYLNNTKLSSKIKFSAIDSVFAIDKGILNIEDIQLETSGNIISGNIIQTGLVIGGNNINLKSLIKIFPDNIRQWTKIYPLEGKADITVSVKGNYSTVENPLITSKFNVYNSSVRSGKWKNQPVNISFTGSFSNGKARNLITSSFEINNAVIKLRQSVLSGNLTISNFITPHLNSGIKGVIYAADINNFLHNDSILFQSGSVNVNFMTNSGFSSFKELNIPDILTNSLNGNINLQDLNVLYSELYPPVTNLNGNINLKRDTWLSDIKFNYGISNYSYKGEIEHILKRFIKKTGSLWIQGDLHSSYSDMSFIFNRPKSDQETAPFKLPYKLFMKLKLFIDVFKLNNFSADNIISDITYKPGFISVSSFHLNTMKGKLEGYGGLIQDLNGNLTLKTDCLLERLDIKEMFEVFNNFKQKFILSENVEGRITGSINFSGNLNSQLEPEMDSIYAETNVIIENGELKDFSPLKKLSKFIELTELEHVTFKTLNNNIVIKDKKVFIPEMAINSSAFNILVSGIHGFDNNFEYRVKVNLSELLAKKARMNKENDEFAVLEKGSQRINLFLTINGNPDDFKIRYDKKEAVNQIRESIKTEKKELKSILYEEFGLFKKQFPDTMQIKKKTNDSSSPEFIFEWDDNEKETKHNNGSKRKKESESKKKDYKIIWE